jgi:type IV secretion system protein VirB10
MPGTSRRLPLECMPGADAKGNTGLEDEVDSHWRELFKAAADETLPYPTSSLVALATLLGAATEIGSSGADNDIIRALRRGVYPQSDRSIGSTS